MNKQNNKNYIMLLIMFAFLSMFLSSCGIYYNSNIKITLNVEANGRLIQSTGVQRISCRGDMPFLGGMGAGNCLLKGEAIPLEISQGKYIFLILGTTQYYIDEINSYEDGTVVKNSNDTRVKWDVKLTKAPMIVTFDDLSEPKSVKAVYFLPHEEVDHYETYRPFPASQELERPIMKTVQPNASEFFGNGVSLKSIHVERTNEMITWGRVEKVLPWLNGRDGGMTLDGKYAQDDRLESKLQTYNFIWR